MDASPLHLRDADAARDAAGITGLMNAARRRFRGADGVTTDDMRSRLARPGLEAGDVVVAERAGRLVGVAETFAAPPYSTIQTFLTVDADDPDVDAVRDVLATAAERAGAGHAARGEAAGRAVLRFWLHGADAEGAAYIERRGYALVRHTLQMVRDLDPGLTTPPAPPAGFRAVDVDGVRDIEAIHDVLDEAFADHDGDARFSLEAFRHLVETSPRYDPTTWQAVADDEGLVGVSLNEPSCAELPDAGLVDVLGVRRRARRRGVGRYLLDASFACFAARGQRRATLFVDAANLTGAVRLYTAAGMQVRFRDDVWERPL